jgi:hypothetical protein
MIFRDPHLGFIDLPQWPQRQHLFSNAGTHPFARGDSDVSDYYFHHGLLFGYGLRSRVG